MPRHAAPRRAAPFVVRARRLSRPAPPYRDRIAPRAASAATRRTPVTSARGDPGRTPVTSARGEPGHAGDARTRRAGAHAGDERTRSSGDERTRSSGACADRHAGPGPDRCNQGEPRRRSSASIAGGPAAPPGRAPRRPQRHVRWAAGCPDRAERRTGRAAGGQSSAPGPSCVVSRSMRLRALGTRASATAHPGDRERGWLVGRGQVSRSPEPCPTEVVAARRQGHVCASEGSGESVRDRRGAEGRR